MYSLLLLFLFIFLFIFVCLVLCFDFILGSSSSCQVQHTLKETSYMIITTQAHLI